MGDWNVNSTAPKMASMQMPINTSHTTPRASNKLHGLTLADHQARPRAVSLQIQSMMQLLFYSIHQPYFTYSIGTALQQGQNICYRSYGAEKW